MTWPPGDFLEDEALGDLSQAVRRRKAPSERDRKQRRRDPLPFQGDMEYDLEGVYPLLAWMILWEGTYSNLYGYYVRDDIRSWGYGATSYGMLRDLSGWVQRRFCGDSERIIMEKQIRGRMTSRCDVFGFMRLLISTIETLTFSQSGQG